MYRIWLLFDPRRALIGLFAHILVWMWRPWIPGAKGYALLDGAVSAAHSALSLIG
jgi:light-harvesting complex 1 beta chain